MANRNPKSRPDDCDDTPPMPDAEGEALVPAARSLTAQEELFVRMYLGDCYGNGHKAMLASGYTPDQAKSHRDLVRVPRIRRAILANLYRCGVTKKRTVAEIALYAFGLKASEFEGYVEGRESLEDLEARGVPTQCIAGVKSSERVAYDKKGNVESRQVVREVKLRDPQKALDQLLKILRLGGSTVEHQYAQRQGSPSQPIEGQLIEIIQTMLDETRSTVTQAELPPRRLLESRPEPENGEGGDGDG